jgi:TonB family protein
MDEVACLLADPAPPCCKQYGGGSKKPPKDPGDKPPANSNLPEKLSREDVSSGIGGVRDRVLGCGDRSSAKGQVTVAVKVSPGGSVSSVSVVSSPDSALGSCVASAVKKARFKATQEGGKFNYPFVIR